jgi:hypothetical protein
LHLSGVYIGARLAYDDKVHRDAYVARFTAGNSVLFASNRSTAKPTKCFGLIPITLNDPNVDMGQTTDGLLEFEAFNQSATDQTVALLAVFYPESGNTTPDLTINDSTGAITGSYTDVGSSDDGVYTAAAVPEPSGLALLALGAGGILARRLRRRPAAE